MTLKFTHARGSSMIEVLVTLVIVAFGLLGLLGLQARALSFQKDSHDGRAAAELAAQLGDRVKANMLGFRDRNYADDTDPGTARVPLVCGAVAWCLIADRDQAAWHAEVLRRLPSAGVYVEPDIANLNAGAWPRFINVTIVWQEPSQGALPTVDAICTDIRTRLNAALPLDYRCYRATVAP